jgi:uncharacterized membrane protein
MLMAVARGAFSVEVLAAEAHGTGRVGSTAAAVQTGASTLPLRRGAESFVATWLAGLVALLPLALTVMVLGWVFLRLLEFVGPGTIVGRFLTAIGYPFARSPLSSYLLGALILAIGVYVLGLIARSGLRRRLGVLRDRTVPHVPIVGRLYAFADRLVGMLDRQEDADMDTMSPVWCVFGGNGPAALALAPGRQTIDIGGRPYLCIWIPNAPAPVSGTLLYVPVDWVRPADIGIDKLTAVYVSMGITQPAPLESSRT